MRVASRKSGAFGQKGISLTVVPRTARPKPAIWNPSLTWCARMVGYSTRNDVRQSVNFIRTKNKSARGTRPRQRHTQVAQTRTWVTPPRRAIYDPRWSRRRPGRSKLACLGGTAQWRCDKHFCASMVLGHHAVRSAQEGHPTGPRIPSEQADHVRCLAGLARIARYELTARGRPLRAKMALAKSANGSGCHCGASATGWSESVSNSSMARCQIHPS